MEISVAICTYNRADRLTLSLESLCQQTLTFDDFEILVIDNASSDRTPQVCTEYQSSLPNLKYIYEPVRGLSKARNTACQQAQGKYIAYLDDDAIACPIWLETILQVFKNIQPTPIGMGGAIYPLWEIPKPEWMHKYMEDLFTVLDYGDRPRWFESDKFPYGANMTYQRPALLAVGGFSENLGRKGQNLLSEEEHLLNLQLQNQGGKFYYHPQAAVEHWIPKERINPNWLVRRSYWQGRSVAMVNQLLGTPLPQLRWESFQKLVHWMNWKRAIAQLWPNQKVRIWTRIWLYWHWGYFYQIWFNLPPKQ